MFGNFFEKKTEKDKKIVDPKGRRKFFEQSAFAGAFILTKPYSFLNNLENQEELKIIKREEWDDLWPKLKERYKLNLGDKYSFELFNKKLNKETTRIRIVKTFAYEGEKESWYSRIIIHHTQIDEKAIVGENELDQIKFLRDSQLFSGFGDITYTHAITPSGKIFECAPENFLSFHSGFTKETSDYLKKNLPNGFSSIRNEKNEEINRQKIEYYKNAQKMDPDYRSLGIVLFGNLNNSEPTKEQLNSLRLLIDKKGGEYHIPKIGIMGHKDVNKIVVEPSGLTLTSSRKKTCPGLNFPPIDDDFLADLNFVETEFSSKKSILLEKF
mgnify:FL=1